MAKRLPKDVRDYLLEDPARIEVVRAHMRFVESQKENEKWRAELLEKRKNAPMVPCGTYGCTDPRNEMDIMCASCQAEYRDDPDAFK